MGYKGFQIADTVEPYFKLMYLPLEDGVPLLHFRDTVRVQKDMPKRFVLYYTNQCPFTAKYVPILEDMAKDRNVEFHSIHIQTREDAQNAPSPFTTFSLCGLKCFCCRVASRDCIP